MMAARLSPADISNPKNAEIMLFQACSDTPPLLKHSIKSLLDKFDASLNILAKYTILKLNLQ